MQNILTMAVHRIIFLVMVAVWLGAVSVAGESRADFSFRPGFGTQRGVCGSGGCGVRSGTSGSQRTSPSPRQREKETEQERARREARWKEQARQKRAALLEMRREIAMLKPSRVSAKFARLENDKVSIGSSFFGLGGGYLGFSGKTPLGLKGPGSEKTKVSRENLRRAISILDPIIKDRKRGKEFYSMSKEDAKFLADQAAFAMAGHPLHVRVEPASERPALTARKIDEAIDLLDDLERAVDRLGEIAQNRRRLGQRLSVLEKQLEKSTNNEAISEYNKLDEQYRKVVGQERHARADLEQKQETFQKKVEVIMVP